MTRIHAPSSSPISPGVRQSACKSSEAAWLQYAPCPFPNLSDGAPIGLGALVDLLEDGHALTVFLAPHGGGARLASRQIQVVTHRSPLGRALVGKRAGDEGAGSNLAGHLRAIEVLGVR